jgi:hypothetical protein
MIASMTRAVAMHTEFSICRSELLAQHSRVRDLIRYRTEKARVAQKLVGGVRRLQRDEQ